MNGFQNPEMVNIWIIGYGNRNRRDDGIGPHVADQLTFRFSNVGGVNMVSLHQLGPELAEDLWAATGVIFIDAAGEPLSRGCSWSKIRPIPDMHRVAHSLTAEALLGMTKLIYNRCPPAWMVSVQGSDFSFGEGLSQSAADSAIQATREITHFILRGLRCESRINLIKNNDRTVNFYIRSKPWAA